MESERKPGYYWIKRKQCDWEIAEFSEGGMWWFIGEDGPLGEFDSDIEQVEDKLITR